MRFGTAYRLIAQVSGDTLKITNPDPDRTTKRQPEIFIRKHRSKN